MSERTPIVWCCPICQRSFDVGCCPEHNPLDHGVEIRVREEPYTAPDNKSGPQRMNARPPVQQEVDSDGRSPE